jgi:hypothetical protein
MLRRAYALNLVVTAIGYFFAWTYAPSLPQMTGAITQSIQSFALDDLYLGPVLFRAIAPH